MWDPVWLCEILSVCLWEILWDVRRETWCNNTFLSSALLLSYIRWLEFVWWWLFLVTGGETFRSCQWCDWCGLTRVCSWFWSQTQGDRSVRAIRTRGRKQLQPEHHELPWCITVCIWTIPQHLLLFPPSACNNSHPVILPRLWYCHACNPIFRNAALPQLRGIWHPTSKN